MLELTKLKAEKTAKIEIRHPVTNKKTGVFFEIMNPDNKEYRQKFKEIMLKSIENKSNDNDEGVIELLAFATVAFEGLTNNGEVLEFSNENAKMIYAEYPFIKEQIDREIANKNNFFLNH